MKPRSKMESYWKREYMEYRKHYLTGPGKAKVLRDFHKKQFAKATRRTDKRMISEGME